jgi:hypothetical protein
VVAADAGPAHIDRCSNLCFEKVVVRDAAWTCSSSSLGRSEELSSVCDKPGSARWLNEPARNGVSAHQYNEALFSWQNFSKNFATFSTLSPSHHIKYTKRYMFGAVNVGKKNTNYTVLMYFATRIF